MVMTVQCFSNKDAGPTVDNQSVKLEGSLTP